jgi:hypothetical protein
MTVQKFGHAVTFVRVAFVDPKERELRFKHPLGLLFPFQTERLIKICITVCPRTKALSMRASVENFKTHLSLVPFVNSFSALYSKTYSVNYRVLCRFVPNLIEGRAYRIQFRISIIIPSLLRRSPIQLLYSYEIQKRISFELFHEQLPLPVPCYDLLPVTEFTVTPRERRFRYSRLP